MTSVYSIAECFLLIITLQQTDGTQTAKTGNLKPVEGIVDKRLGKSYPRVQGGKISKTTKDQSTAQKVVPCRADSSVDPARADQLHVPKPQCKDAKSGRGQIPEYPRPNVSKGFKGVVYTPRALNSKGRIHLPPDSEFPCVKLI